jgi:hypothetical protein
MSLALGIAFQAQAADVSFTGLAPAPADRAFWDIAANWSSMTVPGAADNALLGNFSVVHRNGNSSVSSFLSMPNGALSITGGSLSYTLASNVASFSQSTGVLSGNADVTFSSSSALVGGTQSGTGTTLVGSGTGPYTVGNVRFDNGRTLRNTGTLTQTAGTSFLDFATDAGGSGRLVNEGTFNITTGQVRGLGAGQPADVVRNLGTINKTGTGNYVFAAPLDQRGTFNVSEGTVFLNSNSTQNAGRTRIAASASAVINGSQMQLNGGTIAVEGNLQVAFGAGRLDMQGGVLAGTGTVTDTSYGGTGDHAVSNAAGRIAPGDRDSVGALTLDAGLLMESDGVLEIDILGASTFDSLRVTRASALAGTIDVDPLVGAPTPALGDRFLVATLDAGYTGTFDAVSATEPFGGFFITFNIAHNPNSIELVVGALAPVPEPETYALFATGLGLVLLTVARSRKRTAA